jgi:hypothetical protein
MMDSMNTLSHVVCDVIVVVIDTQTLTRAAQRPNQTSTPTYRLSRRRLATAEEEAAMCVPQFCFWPSDDRDMQVLVPDSTNRIKACRSWCHTHARSRQFSPHGNSHSTGVLYGFGRSPVGTFRSDVTFQLCRLRLADSQRQCAHASD